jgi:hypothetical protein
VRDLLPDWLVLIRRWQRTHGAFPNLLRPSTFNEKVLHRMIFDRRPLLAELADKAAVRTYVEQRLGPNILPTLYHLTSRPDAIPFEILPERFVVKPTHGSGWVRIVSDKHRLDREELVRTCADWLSKNFYQQTLERQYRGITPRILIEQFIGDDSAAAPDDYKLFVFDGRVQLIQLDVGRFDHHRRRLYTPQWEPIDALYGYDDIDNAPPAPAHLSEMIAAAEVLGRGLDFVRADFYDSAGGLYFGELTMTPEASRLTFRPRSFDSWLGGHWTLPPP